MAFGDGGGLARGMVAVALAALLAAPGSDSDSVPSRRDHGHAGGPAHGQGNRRIRVASDSEITNAIRGAVPGDVIVVAPGSYGPILVPRGKSGGPGAPITLVSEKPRAARIVQPKGRGAILMGGSKHWVIDGFHVVGGRNGIQASNNGFSYASETLIEDIVIRNNLVEGVVEDGVKANGGSNVQILDNVVHGGNDQGIDVDAVRGFRVSGNVVTCNNGQAGIISKMGATDGVIAGNQVSDCAQGIKAGDISDTQFPKKPGAPFYPGSTYEVARISIVDNDISSRGAPIVFTGAIDSSARGNRVRKFPDRGPLVIVRESPGYTRHPTWHSRNIDIDIRDRVDVREGSALRNRN